MPQQKNDGPKTGSAEPEQISPLGIVVGVIFSIHEWNDILYHITLLPDPRVGWAVSVPGRPRECGIDTDDLILGRYVQFCDDSQPVHPPSVETLGRNRKDIKDLVALLLFKILRKQNFDLRRAFLMHAVDRKGNDPELFFTRCQDLKELGR